MNDQFKFCRGCSKWLAKTLANFHRDVSRRDGFQNRCRLCKNKEVRENIKKRRAVLIPEN